MNIKDYIKVQKSCLVNKKVIETHCGRMVRAAKLLSLCLVRFVPTQQNEDRLQHNEIRSFFGSHILFYLFVCFNKVVNIIQEAHEWAAKLLSPYALLGSCQLSKMTTGCSAMKSEVFESHVFSTELGEHWTCDPRVSARI